jgi:hypothetical protein
MEIAPKHFDCFIERYRYDRSNGDNLDDLDDLRGPLSPVCA